MTREGRRPAKEKKLPPLGPGGLMMILQPPAGETPVPPEVKDKKLPKAVQTWHPARRMIPAKKP